MPAFRLLFPGLLCSLFFFSGCKAAKKWKLMPTPLVHQHIGKEVYEEVERSDRSQSMEVFFVTNRPASGPAADRRYGNGIVDNLQVGEATVRLGKPGLGWSELVKISVRGERKGKVSVRHTGTKELGDLSAGTGADFAARINEELATKRFPDITIYLHGARTTFTDSVLEGAQLHHFMTRETAFISFAWPSTGKIIRYKKDVDYAAGSADRFADLIEFLAANTNAKRINVLGYSAGAAVAAPGLAELRKRHPGKSPDFLKRKLRLGEIYFAAADVGLRDFGNHYLPAFIDIVDNVTVAYNKADGVLKFAQRIHDNESRLGKPDSGQLSEREYDYLVKVVQGTRLDALDMEYSTGKRAISFNMHGAWQLNPWVSSDAIIQFLRDLPPAERGLERRPDVGTWFFPPDYPEKLKRLVEEARE